MKIIFRGHQEESWKITSTLARYSSTLHQNWDTRIDEMLTHFIVNALSIGTITFPRNDRRSRLEYGRHYGVPSPLIDFSWSPFVAMFFAFNGIQYRHGSTPKNAAVYALSIQSLRVCCCARDYGAEFTLENGETFKHHYPANALKFLRSPASWNQRMQRQLGCFVYDTLPYGTAGFGQGNFEDWIDSINEPGGPNGKKPTLIKFLIPHSEAKNVFPLLELMNINATKLIDHEGLAADVKNSYNYNRKTGYAWDVVVPPPDEGQV